jgi:hypothetical protein
MINSAPFWDEEVEDMKEGFEHLKEGVLEATREWAGRLVDGGEGFEVDIGEETRIPPMWGELSVQRTVEAKRVV